jgi:hypothetical protein
MDAMIVIERMMFGVKQFSDVDAMNVNERMMFGVKQFSDVVLPVT